MDLKVKPLFPVETKLPALHHFAIPAQLMEKNMDKIHTDDLPRFIQTNPEKKYVSIPFKDNNVMVWSRLKLWNQIPILIPCKGKNVEKF